MRIGDLGEQYEESRFIAELAVAERQQRPRQHPTHILRADILVLVLAHEGAIGFAVQGHGVV